MSEGQVAVSEYHHGWNPQTEKNYWIPPCDIEGLIPSDLHGTFLRNGPGLTEVYGTKLKHPIDSDGMVCALTFCNGRVHFKSKFVESKHRIEEKEQKAFIYPGQMGTRKGNFLKDMLSASVGMVSGNFPKLVFRNPSNTNVFYWGGKVLTCYETHLPHCLDPYTLNTIGEDDLKGALDLKAMAAHFRIDPVEKRLVVISLKPGVQRLPSLGVYEFDQHWNLYQKQMQHIPGLNYAHDFLLLPDYYLFHMSPFVKVTKWEAFKILSNITSPGESMKLYPDLPSRFVLIPRDPKKKNEVIQIDTDNFHIFHFGTAEQQGDVINFNAVCLGADFNMTFDQGLWLSNTSVAPGHIHSFQLNLTKRTCTGQKMDEASVEFPTTHPYRHGMAGTRYSYFMANDRRTQPLPYQDVIKFDSQGESRQVWSAEGVIGEPVFVPRYGYESTTKGDEDDGFVLVQLFEAKQQKTSFCVLDAKDITKGPICKIKLKHHIPYGFHGTFCQEVFKAPPEAILPSKL